MHPFVIERILIAICALSGIVLFYTGALFLAGIVPWSVVQAIGITAGILIGLAVVVAVFHHRVERRRILRHELTLNDILRRNQERRKTYETFQQSEKD